MPNTSIERELQQIRYALDASTILAITDKKGVITYVNDKFCEISGYERNELIGQTHSIINSSHHDIQFWRNLWRTISMGKTWHGIIRNINKQGGHYWVDTTIVPFLDENDSPVEYIAIRKDITDRILAEEQTEVHKAKALQSEKMAALGEMASGIAHELGNPMGALRGRIEMLEFKGNDRGSVDKVDIEQFAQRATQIIDRMALIIKGLQSYARDASNDPFRSANISTLVSEVLEFSAAKLRKNSVSIRNAHVDADVFADCREAEIGQVILNLVSNAADAVKDQEERWIEIRLKELSDRIRLTVTDSGQGIPEEVARSIFNPFFTTKEVGQGTGLGLSISKKIADLHDGTLDIDRNAADTTFYLEIPKHHHET